MTHWIAIALFGVAVLMACGTPADEAAAPLPVYGFHDTTPDGDTLYHTISDFKFVNQAGDTITNATFAGKAYLVDFFFLSCSTICPKVSKQMLRLYEEFEDQDDILLLAHTVDPKRDTVGALRTYASNLGVKADKWHFVTGDKDEIYEIAEDYLSVAVENPDAPDGIDHSGRIILVDPQGRVRAYANGTDPIAVEDLMVDIRRLLAEMNSPS